MRATKESGDLLVGGEVASLFDLIDRVRALRAPSDLCNPSLVDGSADRLLGDVLIDALEAALPQ
jgi:hypothetical protein